MTEVTDEIKRHAREIHRSAIVVDTVNRSLMDQRFFQDIKTGGVTLLGRTILVSSADVFSPFGFMESLRDITQTIRIVDQHSDELMMVKTASDILRAKESGKVGLYVYFQSPEPLDTQLWRLRLFYELGLRVLQLSYNQRSLAGDGCAERVDAGLSDFGVALIGECERLGIAIDLSHCGYRTTMEAIELSNSPVLMTHTNSRAVLDTPRNKTDEQVRACAAKGGVIGVEGVASFTAKDPSKVSIYDVLDHLDHHVQVAGIDHVGLGLDITTGHGSDSYVLLGYKEEMYAGTWDSNGAQRYPAGLSTLGELPNLTEQLLARGYSRPDIEKILGGNFLRVFKLIWK